MSRETASLASFRGVLRHLVAGFESNTPEMRVHGYDEANLRAEYIDPFFAGLGWDVGNSRQVPLHLRDVVVEKRTDERGRNKRVDYLFRAGGLSKFVCEAKKPWDHIDRHYFQVQNYVVNSGVWLGILFDFEHFIVFVVGSAPNKKKPFPPVDGWRLHYRQYEAMAQIIWDLFSREKVEGGSLEAFIQGLPKIANLHARQGWLIRPDRSRVVDDSFLGYLDAQRSALAKGLLQLNRRAFTNSKELSEAVQIILDRIIFQRVCEDRDIDTHANLESIVAKWHATGRHAGALWPTLVGNFRNMEITFNGGLFREHFVDDLEVPEEWLGDFLDELCDPQSNYLFSTMPVEILGSVYERFLGSEIQLNGTIRVKPEIQKAGGIVYTPQYIVEKIVDETVGAVVEGLSPKQIATVRILDPACGSGTFLLSALERLCEYHVEWFLQHPRDQKVELCYRDHNGDLHLTTRLKRQIVLNNLFGVDKDPAAVEVTQLSLYLKILEGEDRGSLRHQRSLFPRETFLPDLSANIRCGNSLITQEMVAQVNDADVIAKINPFDWSFGKNAKGKFDAIIGNPPYVRIQAMHEYAPEEAALIRSAYTTAISGTTDLYVPFIERGIQLLRSSGRMGQIISSKWMMSEYGAALRTMLASKALIQKIVSFGHLQVFEGRSTYTMLLFLQKQNQETVQFEKVENLKAWAQTGASKTGARKMKDLNGSPWDFVTDEEDRIARLFRSVDVKLSDVADVFVGVQTSADKIFILRTGDQSLRCQVDDSEWQLESDLMHPLLSGRHVSGYAIRYPEQAILFPYEVNVEEQSATLIPWRTLRRDFPECAKYLSAHRATLANRERRSFDDDEWYRFGRSQNLGRQPIRKLCVPRLVKQLEVAYDEDAEFWLDNVDVCGISFKPGFEHYDLLFLLGWLNSTPIKWYFPLVSAPFQGGYWSANKQFVGRVPVVLPNLDSRPARTAYEQFIGMVAETKRTIAKAKSLKTSVDKGAYALRIEKLRNDIDTYVADALRLPASTFDSIRRSPSVADAVQ